jgi:Putative DNA-binding domain
VPLADFQAQVRGAVVDGRIAPLAPILTGGVEPLKRFAIHRRHYEASLVRALVEKFPALAWLAGSPFVSAAASNFIRQRPPCAPCIAEYGETFPAFLADRPETKDTPWLRWVGDLEWQLGHVSLALEYAPLPIDALAATAPERLADCMLTLQPGLRYLAAPWPVDELLELFLSDNAPEIYALDPQDIYLEVRGARGAFSMSRVDATTFMFRRLLAQGSSVGSAAEQALDADPSFDAGRGLAQLIAAGLAIAIGGAKKDTPQ